MTDHQVLENAGLPFKDSYTLPELAQATGLKIQTLQRYCNPKSKNFCIPATKVGRSFMVKRKDAVHFIARSKEKRTLVDPKLILELEKEIVLTGENPNDVIKGLIEAIRSQRIEAMKMKMVNPEKAIGAVFGESSQD